MWYALLTVIYTGFNPTVGLKPATVIGSVIVNGYPSFDACNSDKSLSNYTSTKFSSDYTILTQCFMGDPRLVKYTSKR